jgi:hypothetical protein
MTKTALDAGSRPSLPPQRGPYKQNGRLTRRRPFEDTRGLETFQYHGQLTRRISTSNRTCSHSPVPLLALFLEHRLDLCLRYQQLTRWLFEPARNAQSLLFRQLLRGLGKVLDHARCCLRHPLLGHGFSPLCIGGKSGPSLVISARIIGRGEAFPCEPVHSGAVKLLLVGQARGRLRLGGPTLRESGYGTLRAARGGGRWRRFRAGEIASPVLLRTGEMTTAIKVRKGPPWR